jgi:hypothetical protein
MQPDCPPWDLPEKASDVPSVVSGLIAFQQFVYKNSEKHILLHGDLKTWHQRIFRDVVPIRYYAGNYRGVDPARPCLERDVQVGGLPGAPFAEVHNQMRSLSDEMRDAVVETDKYVKGALTPANRARAVIQLAALYSGRFLRIHPFPNCHGRTSRIISNYVFGRYGYPMPYYNPYPRPGVPYAQVTAPCMVGDFKPMFRYLLGVLAAATLA